MIQNRVVLAMSGGVDSSVSAWLLKREGYEVIGLFMRTGVHSGQDDHRADHKKGCCSAIDAGDARKIADKLDIPFYALDFEEDFNQIIDYFADEYLRGRTPNPCVDCHIETEIISNDKKKDPNESKDLLSLFTIFEHLNGYSQSLEKMSPN